MRIAQKLVIAGRSFNPNTPALVPGLSMWYDAADPTTIIQSAGSISQWSDKSGTARHATQAVAGKQPTFRQGAKDGLNAVGFAVANLQLFSLPVLNINAGGYSFFGVFKKGTNLFEGFGHSATPLLTIPEFTGPGFYFFDLGTNDLSNSNPLPKAGVWQQLTMLMTGAAATSAMYVNGGLLTPLFLQANAFNGIAIDQLGAGDSTTCEGLMAEMLFYNVLVSDANRLTIQSYLKAKWGTP